MDQYLEIAALLQASPLAGLRHTEASWLFWDICVQISGRVGLNEQGNGPRNLRRTHPEVSPTTDAQPPSLSLTSHTPKHHATFIHTQPRTAWCHCSSLPDASASITLSIPLLALFFYWHMLMHICQWRNSFWLPITAGDWSSSTDVPIHWCPWCTVVKEVIWTNAEGSNTHEKIVCSSKLK